MEFINWPVAGMVLGIISLVVFRAPIARLIDRTVRLRGILDTAAPAQSPPPHQSLISSESGEAQSIEALTKRFDNALLVEQQANISTDLGQYKLAPAEREQFLIRHLAGTQIALHFERALSYMMGPHVRILRHLNSQAESQSLEQLRPFYDASARRYPAIYKDYTLQDLLMALAAFNLITEENPDPSDTESDPEGIQLTVLGREFLKYLVDQGKQDPEF